MSFGAVVIAILLSGVVFYLLFKNIEHVFCMWRHNVPFVPSEDVLRRAVVDEIRTHYHDMKTLCDIGAGYGGMMRYVTRRTGMRSVGLENMPFSALVSWIMDTVTWSSSKTIWCDAFEYLAAGHKFDIGVAYLAPWVNGRLKEHMDNFRVLITLDVPVPDLEPARIIDVGHGFTYYGRKKFPHRLFVYEF